MNGFEFIKNKKCKVVLRAKIWYCLPRKASIPSTHKITGSNLGRFIPEIFANLAII